jgi:hypothetical protein
LYPRNREVKLPIEVRRSAVPYVKYCMGGKYESAQCNQLTHVCLQRDLRDPNKDF